MTGDNGQMVRAEAWIFAAGHLSHGNPTRRAQRQPISYLVRASRTAAPRLARRSGRMDLDSRRPRGMGGRNAAADHLSLAPSRQGRGARGAAAGHVSLGSSTRGAFAAGATGTQRRPIYSFGAVLAADHLLLGISTHDARAAGAAGTQRRPISCLATQLAAPSIRVRAVAAGVQRRPMSRLVARLTESRRLRGGRGPDAAGR
eukprot:tig00000219_g19536.t4